MNHPRHAAALIAAQYRPLRRIAPGATASFDLEGADARLHRGVNRPCSDRITVALVNRRMSLRQIAGVVVDARARNAHDGIHIVT